MAALPTFAEHEINILNKKPKAKAITATMMYPLEFLSVSRGKFNAFFPKMQINVVATTQITLILRTSVAVSVVSVVEIPIFSLRPFYFYILSISTLYN
jgi:hypothetical protein